MMNRPLDPKVMEIFKGSSASRGLEEMKVQLALIQSACLMALEGTTRATATEITSRAMTEFGIEATASFTGQVFAGLGTGTAMTHGKNRFILEQVRLEEIRKSIAARCEELAGKLESSIKYFRALPERIETLEKEWRDILKLRVKERELLNYINEEGKKPSQLSQLVSEVNRLKEQATRADELQKECRSLTRKIKSLPSLEERRKSLQAAIAAYEAKVKEFSEKERLLAAREEELADWITTFQKRLGWVDLITLEQAIQRARNELDTLSEQLGEKRSLLDRLLRRKEAPGDKG